MSVFRCIEPFAATIDGVPHVYRAGDLVDSKDKALKGRDRFFEPVEIAADRAVARKLGVNTPAAVETATAAPGERRSRQPAKKSAAKKSAAKKSEPKPATGTSSKKTMSIEPAGDPTVPVETPQPDES